MKQHFLGRIQDVILAEGREVVTDLERPPCDRCNPDFRPQLDSRGRPRPPVGLCSKCVAERVGSRVIEPAEAPRVDPHHVSQLSKRAAAAYETWQERQAARPGYAAPGSQEEEQVLAIIDGQRDADEATKFKGGAYRGARGVLEVPIVDRG